MEPIVQENDEIEIDMVEAAGYLLKRMWIILLSGMVCAILAAAYTLCLITPKYTSTTSMYILNRQATESITNSDLQSSTQLIEDYMVLTGSRSVLETVIEDLGLDLTYLQLKDKVSISTDSGTRVMRISVTDEEPETARRIADGIRQTAAVRIQEVMNVDAVNVVDEADMPKEPSSPNLKKNVLIAAALAILTAIVVFMVRFIMDDKVNDTEDVEKYLGISVLGNIPLDEEAAKKKAGRKKSGKR